MRNFLKNLFNSQDKKDQKQSLSNNITKIPQIIEEPFNHICLKSKPKKEIGLFSMALEYNYNPNDYYWFSEGLTIICDNETKQNGFMDKEGNIVIPPQFKKARPFSNGLASVTFFDEKLEKNLEGKIDTIGNLVIPYSYESISDFKNGVAIASKFVNAHESDYLFINIHGQPLFDTKKFSRLQQFNDNLAAVQYNGKWGYIDMEGNVIIPFSFTNAQPFVNGYAIVTNNELKSGIINSKGEMTVPFSFDVTGRITDGLIQIKKDKKYGFINVSGEEVIPAKYCSATIFEEGLAAVKESTWDKWSFIDTSGEIVLNEITDAEEYSFPSFHEGYSQYYKDGNYGFMNRKGEVVVSPVYSNVSEVYEGYAFVKDDIRRIYGFLRMK